MNICLHSNQRRWFHYWRPRKLIPLTTIAEVSDGHFYWCPRKLTLNSNPAVYRWLFWVWGGNQPKEPRFDFSLFSLFLIALLALDIVMLAVYFTR
jgi:hypothetical protein